MLVKFEQNRMVQTTRNFDLFDKKTNKQTKTKTNKTKQKTKQNKTKQNKTKQNKTKQTKQNGFDKELTSRWKTFL